jgi:hypothetical protein
MLLPWFRTSWCYNCHWEGLLRRGVVAEGSSAPRTDDAHPNVKT